jgi:hypothetical protein
MTTSAHVQLGYDAFRSSSGSTVMAAGGEACHGNADLCEKRLAHSGRSSLKRATGRRSLGCRVICDHGRVGRGSSPRSRDMPHRSSSLASPAVHRHTLTAQSPVTLTRAPGPQRRRRRRRWRPRRDRACRHGPRPRAALALRTPAQDPDNDGPRGPTSMSGKSLTFAPDRRCTCRGGTVIGPSIASRSIRSRYSFGKR